ncbi:MAG: phosphatidylserine/phosphatidylglycerophosphate/cardiolipin synthase family protein [Acidobacteriota bacterium]|nr:phosphatidylserine/phosphatidylglycerophosphate/cardiolipin synthase family protein [Blastocatellia bacterium]MDW8411139.1 phosphatidylserine/phosphatidylglycerophosphate/cardiolipin synthase family protein [Acidobacteriota bacterium]
MRRVEARTEIVSETTEIQETQRPVAQEVQPTKPTTITQATASPRRPSIGSTLIQSQLKAAIQERLRTQSLNETMHEILSAARRFDSTTQMRTASTLNELRKLIDSNSSAATKAEQLLRSTRNLLKTGTSHRVLENFASEAQQLTSTIDFYSDPSSARQRLSALGFAQTTIRKLSDSSVLRLTALDSSVLREVGKKNSTMEQEFAAKIDSLPQDLFAKLVALPATEQARITSLSTQEMVAELNRSGQPTPPQSDATQAKEKLAALGFAKSTLKKLSDKAAIRLAALDTSLLSEVAKRNVAFEQEFAAKIESLPEDIFDRLRQLPPDTQKVTAFKTREQIIAELKPSTDVVLHSMPEATSAPLVEAINRARESIDLSIYLFTSKSVTEALKQAAARGVRVRVMLEPEVVGQKDANLAKAEELRAAGIEVKDTPPEFSEGNRVDHAKFMIIDNKELLFGTGNLARSGLGESSKPKYNNRDFWVSDKRSESVAEAVKLFDADWNRRSTAGIEFKHLVVTPDNAAQKLFDLIDGAQRRLLVYNQSLADQTIIDKLIAAKQRGVDVKVILNDPRSADDKNLAARAKLEAAGIPCGFYRKHIMHAKAMVADDQAYIGSQNFTSGGLYNNREFGQIISEPRFVRQLEEVFMQDYKTTGLVTGDRTQELNQIRLHPMPDSSNYPIIAAINSATTSIDLEVYILTDPGVTDALKLAAKRGVRVRVMLEPKTIGETKPYEAKAAELRAAGIEVKETPPEFNSNYNVDHAKFMIIDGRDLLFGTGNLVKSGLGESMKDEWNNRDFWVQNTYQEAVREAQLLFERDWNRQSTADIDFKHLVVTPDNANSRITNLIDSATDRLYVFNQTLTDQTIIDKLIAAKQRGVDVRVLLAKPEDGDPNRPALEQLAAAGIKVNYFTKHYLHAKGIVSDNQAFLGSQNFTGGGLFRNREVGQIFNQPDIVNQLAEIFLADEANPTRV